PVRVLVPDPLRRRKPVLVLGAGREDVRDGDAEDGVPRGGEAQHAEALVRQVAAHPPGAGRRRRAGGAVLQHAGGQPEAIGPARTAGAGVHQPGNGRGVEWQEERGMVMQLEDYFEFLGPNEIKIKDHRIWVENVLYEYIYRDQTVEELVQRFDTLTMEQV